MSSTSDFLTTAEKERVVAAIAEAEKKTFGEIRIHLENWCWTDAYKHGKDVFMNLGMDKTGQHSGVLIYVAVKSHKAAIIGDAGINAKVPDGFWAITLAAMLQKFRDNNYADGLADAVHECGEELAKHFPRTDSDTDELTNEISFGS